VLCKRTYLTRRPSLSRKPTVYWNYTQPDPDLVLPMILLALFRPSSIPIGFKTLSSTFCIRVTPSSNRMMASSAQTSTGLKSSDLFIYGTAWKKDQTKALVKQALSAGFLKIDTAAQPKHYQEELVGEAIRETIKEGIVRREDLYVSAVEDFNGKRRP
jgi:hypothetical protein